MADTKLQRQKHKRIARIKIEWEDWGLKFNKSHLYPNPLQGQTGANRSQFSILYSLCQITEMLLADDIKITY